MSAFGEDDGRRKVILVLSDGKDSGPTSFRERPSSQADVIDRARQEDVMIYAVGLRSRNNRALPPGGLGPGGLQAMLVADLPDPALARVAEETGGGYLEIRFGQDLGAAFAGVADELHTQYLLAFTPPKRDGKVHDVSVRVTPGRPEDAGEEELRGAEGLSPTRRSPTAFRHRRAAATPTRASTAASTALDSASPLCSLIARGSSTRTTQMKLASMTTEKITSTASALPAR